MELVFERNEKTVRSSVSCRKKGEDKLDKILNMMNEIREEEKEIKDGVP